MAHSPNQASGTGSTGKPKGKVKPKGSAPQSAADRWNANKHHSTDYAGHLANIKAKRQLGTTNLTDPPSAAQAITEANSAADLQFGPQQRAAQQQMANVEPWFQQHIARVAGYAQAAQQQAAPVLQQGQAFENATGQTAPGLDPNSEAGRASAMAAQGRAALAALGNSALKTEAQSTADMFGGMQANASQQLPYAKQAAADKLAGVESDRGNAINTFLTDARTRAQNYSIARGTLAGNIANSAADAATAAANTAETHRHNVAGEKHDNAATQAAADAAAAKGSEPNKYGVPADQWARFSTSHRQRIIDKARGKSTGPSAADKKHDQGVRDKSSRQLGRLDDVNNAINIHSRDQVPQTEIDQSTGKEKPVLVKDPKTGKMVQATAKPTDQQITNKLLDEGYSPTEIRLAKRLDQIAHGKGAKLTSGEVDALHKMGVRVPRRYIAVPTGGANENPVQGQGAGDMR